MKKMTRFETRLAPFDRFQLHFPKLPLIKPKKKQKKTTHRVLSGDVFEMPLIVRAWNCQILNRAAENQLLSPHFFVRYMGLVHEICAEPAGVA
jgi:hypothetical protein